MQNTYSTIPGSGWGEGTAARRWPLSILMAVVLLAGAAWLAACGSDARGKAPQQEALAAELRALESQLAQGLSQLEVDTAAALSLVEKAQLYAERFAQDSLAPHFLFRAADAARGIGDYALAVQLWDQVAQSFGDSPRAPQALFLQAFTLENDLRDHTAARRAYEDFLSRYPDHPWAKDALALLQALESGKTPEELIREFQQQEQE